MKDFVCFPQRKYTDCGSCVYDKTTSADWFYEAFNNSPATESGMLQLWPRCLFVGIGLFDDSSNTDCLMKSKLRASFPTNYTKSDTRALSIIWLLDVGVSTTWSWGDWDQKVSIKSEVKWWSSFPALPEIVVTTNAAQRFCILPSNILTSNMTSGCMVLAGCMSTFKWVWS